MQDGNLTACGSVALPGRGVFTFVHALRSVVTLSPLRGNTSEGVATSEVSLRLKG
jgi:hypothetical protein